MTYIYELPANTWGIIDQAQGVYKGVSARLESGEILNFPQLNFTLAPGEQAFLTPDILKRGKKNISYDCATDALSGNNLTPENAIHLKAMMRRFNADVVRFLSRLLPEYQGFLQAGRTSFRPAEIEGRPTSPRQDDTRLHVDAFPASPNQGQRILRFFSNINPTQDRRWCIGEGFEQVAERFLLKIAPPIPLSHTVLHKLHLTKTKRTLYDHYMLKIHHSMKEDTSYQKTVARQQVALSPGSSWMVFTDLVSHAVLSGQHVLEQTFLLDVDHMVSPEKSPLRILERLKNQPLV